MYKTNYCVQATPGFSKLFHAGWKGNKSLKILCGGDLLSETLAGISNSCKELWNMYIQRSNNLVKYKK
jgi:hypothetical protein